MKPSIEAAVASFGAKTKAKLNSLGASGQPEDQIRAPFEQLLSDLAELCHFPPRFKRRREMGDVDGGRPVRMGQRNYSAVRQALFDVCGDRLGWPDDAIVRAVIAAGEGFSTEHLCAVIRACMPRSSKVRTYGFFVKHIFARKAKSRIPEALSVRARWKRRAGEIAEQRGSCRLLLKQFEKSDMSDTIEVLCYEDESGEVFVRTPNSRDVMIENDDDA